MYVLLKQENNNHIIPDSDSQGRKAGRQERGARGFTWVNGHILILGLNALIVMLNTLTSINNSHAWTKLFKKLTTHIYKFTCFSNLIQTITG